jgi:hypothetical protein
MQMDDDSDNGGAPASPRPSLMSDLDALEEEQADDECPAYVIEDFKTIPELLCNKGPGRRFRFPTNPVPDEHSLVPPTPTSFSFLFFPDRSTL